MQVKSRYEEVTVGREFLGGRSITIHSAIPAKHSPILIHCEMVSGYLGSSERIALIKNREIG